jgi:epoxyqueuosine reductase QueG
MTKAFGPRVRLGAVTTSLPLILDKPADIGVEDFCRICKKCATCCPSQSIPMGEQTVVNGTLRWKLNEQTCFDYWGKIGTDCNICMRVCPWSHARTFPHKLIVELVSRNRRSRRIFNVMDDVFYGRRPKPKPAPAWASLK